MLQKRSELAATAAQADATCGASIELQRAAVRDPASGNPGRYGTACVVKQFAYRVARRLLKVEVADLVSLDIGPLCHRPPPSSRLEFRFLAADEICAAAGDPAYDLDSAMAGRLECGRNFCCAALDGGRLANYSWYALGQIEPEHSFGVGLVLPDDTVYMYKAFTLPCYRRQRLHELTIRRAAQFFARMDIRRLIAIVEYGNWASQISHERIGCRQAGRFYRIGHRLILRRGNSELGFWQPS